MLKLLQSITALPVVCVIVSVLPLVLTAALPAEAMLFPPFGTGFCNTGFA